MGRDTYKLEGGQVIALSALSRFGTVDLAVSLKSTADYTVIASFGAVPDGRLLLLGVDRARREGPDIVPAMRRAVDRWSLDAVWVEKVGFQLSIIQEARRAGLPVREATPDRDKVSRAIPVTAALEGGRLLLPRVAPWLRDYEAELLGFPNAPHDDMVDCTSTAIAVHANRRKLTAQFCAGPPDDGVRREPVIELPNSPFDRLPASPFDDSMPSGW